MMAWLLSGSSKRRRCQRPLEALFVATDVPGISRRTVHHTRVPHVAEHGPLARPE